MAKKHDFTTLFLQRYPRRKTIISYMQEAIGKDTINICDLTRVNWSKICDTILSHVCNGAAKTYFSELKAFVNLYKDEIKFPCTDLTKLLHAKRQPSQHIYLTEDEIIKLEDYLERIENTPTTRIVQTQCEVDVLHAFLAECYCGARGCDVAAFTSDNFAGGMLSYVSKKTKVLSVLPIHRNLMQHINHQPAKEYSPVTLNRTLKRVCKVCGIDEPKTLFYHGKLQTHPKYEFVGFHTARRSFATNLSLRNVPLPVICQMMNHGQDLLMTQRYIVTDKNSLSDSAQAFFN